MTKMQLFEFLRLNLTIDTDVTDGILTVRILCDDTILSESKAKLSPAPMMSEDTDESPDSVDYDRQLNREAERMIRRGREGWNKPL